MKQTLLLISAIVISNMSIAQDKAEIKGDKFFEKHYYAEAIQQYEKSTERPDSINLKLGRANFKLFHYDQAIKHFVKCFNKGNITNPDLILYGKSLVNTGKYHDLDPIIARIESNISIEEAQVWKTWQSWLINHINDEPKFLIHEVNINTGGVSLGCVPHKEGIIYSEPQSPDPQTETVFYDLVYARKIDSVTFGSPEKLFTNLNGKFFEGPATVESNDKIMYFSSNASEQEKTKESKFEKHHIAQDGENKLQIYRVEFINDVWRNKVLASFVDLKSNYTHPVLSRDGKTLYFSSDREGGYGGFDIYKVTKTPNGWSEPVNLGANVNTKEDEGWPTVKDDKLYFASRGHYTFGGMDVFVSQIDENGVCTKAQNIGKNINSEHDDFALIWNEDNKTGYFSSNRIDEKEFDHIFYFQEIDLIDTIKVIVRDFETNDLLTFVDVKALLEEGENDEIINIITDEDGAFELVLKKGFGYDIVCKKDGYESLNHKLSVGPKKDLELYLKPILKEPNKELPRPLNKEIPDNFTEVIYFELNSSYLNTENLNTLEKVVPILKEHPNWKIVVESHADIRAPENYNIWLSERRMLRVKNWLVNQGIDGNRISGAYYGETKPKIDCGSSCNEEEFRINRRTTIRVTDGQGI